MSEAKGIENVVEVSKEQKAKEVIKKVKEQKFVEKKVNIIGVSEPVATAINTVIIHIDNTKTTSNAQVEGATKELESVSEDIDLLTHVEDILNNYDNLSKTYRDVVKKLNTLTDYRDKIEAFIKLHQTSIKEVDDTIAKVRSHIVETTYEDHVDLVYDKVYFEAFLDLAYVIFDIAPKEDGSVALKTKGEK